MKGHSQDRNSRGIRRPSRSGSTAELRRLRL